MVIKTAPSMPGPNDVHLSPGTSRNAARVDNEMAFQEAAFPEALFGIAEPGGVNRKRIEPGATWGRGGFFGPGTPSGGLLTAAAARFPTGGYLDS